MDDKQFTELLRRLDNISDNLNKLVVIGSEPEPLIGIIETKILVWRLIMIMQFCLSIALVIAGITLFYISNKYLRKNRTKEGA